MSSRKSRAVTVREGGIRGLLADRTFDGPIEVVSQFERLRNRVRREKCDVRSYRHIWVRSTRDHQESDDEGQFPGGMDGRASQAGLKCWALDWEMIERRSRES